MKKMLIISTVLFLGAITPSLAQPCYSSEQCAAIRYQAQAQQRAQFEADARARRQARIDEANAQAAQEAAARQAAIDQAAAQEAAAQEQRRREDAAAAQLAAEQSPDNRCRDPKLAGQLIDGLNLIRSTQDFNQQVVDIQHLVTVRYDGPGVFVCHGAFVLENSTRITGSVISRLNVAGRPLISFHSD